MKHYYRHVGINISGSIHAVDVRSDLNLLKATATTASSTTVPSNNVRECAEGHLGYLLGELRGSVDGVTAIRPDVVGLGLIS